MVKIVVDTILDVVDPEDGLTSLREAIELANDTTAGIAGTGDADDDGNANDTISFSQTLAGQTITLAGFELGLTSDVTIDGDINGDGAADVIVNGNGTSGVFEVTAGTAIFESLNITGGTGSGTFDASGGGLFIADGAIANVSNSTFSANIVGVSIAEQKGTAVAG